MKNSLTRFHSPGLEASIKLACDQLLQKIKLSAEKFGLKNLPRLQQDKIQGHFEEHHFEYQKLIDQVNTEIQFKTTCHDVVEAGKVAENQLRELKNKISEAKDEEIKIDGQLKGLPEPVSLLKLLMPYVAVIIICLFEGILAIPVFELWASNYIEAILGGLGFAVLLALFAHYFFQIVSWGKTQMQQRMIAVALLLLLTGVFCGMGLRRAEHLSSLLQGPGTGEQAVNFSPVLFVCMSIILFLVAVAIRYFSYPTSEQWNHKKIYQDLKAIKHQKECEGQALKTECEKVDREYQALKSSSASMLVYGAMAEAEIINSAKAGFALWKTHNRMHRPDGCTPDCFHSDYPFLFKTNFDSI